MAKEINELIGDLCALKAGLSILSQNIDEIKPCQNIIKKQQDYKANFNAMLADAETAMSDTRAEYQEKKAKHDFIVKVKTKQKMKESDYNFFAVYLAAFALGEGVGGGIGTIILTLLALIFLTPIFLISIPFQIIIYFAKKSRLKRKVEKDLDEEIKEYEKTLLKGEQTIKDAYDVREEKFSEADSEINQQKKRIEEIVKSSNCIYNSLLTLYSPLLSEKDWEELELIIWQLVSGRADNLKETLILCDRIEEYEKKNAVCNAGKKLNSVLKKQENGLENDIERGFAKFLEQISNQCKRMSVQSESGKEIAQQDLQTALVSESYDGSRLMEKIELLTSLS